MLRALQWTGRGLGVFLVGLFALFIMGEGVPSPLSLTASELVCGAAFLLMLAGLVAAWKWEGPGSLCIPSGFAAFWGANAAATGSLQVGWVFPVLAWAGLLIAVHWWEMRIPPGR